MNYSRETGIKVLEFDLPCVLCGGNYFTLLHRFVAIEWYGCCHCGLGLERKL